MPQEAIENVNALGWRARAHARAKLPPSLIDMDMRFLIWMMMLMIIMIQTITQ
jgi:hypothetical protein